MWNRLRGGGGLVRVELACGGILISKNVTHKYVPSRSVLFAVIAGRQRDKTPTQHLNANWQWQDWNNWQSGCNSRSSSTRW